MECLECEKLLAEKEFAAEVHRQVIRQLGDAIEQRKGFQERMTLRTQIYDASTRISVAEARLQNHQATH
jgi:hypothetical protein